MHYYCRPVSRFSFCRRVQSNQEMDQTSISPTWEFPWCDPPGSKELLQGWLFSCPRCVLNLFSDVSTNLLPSFPIIFFFKDWEGDLRSFTSPNFLWQPLAKICFLALKEKKWIKTISFLDFSLVFTNNKLKCITKLIIYIKKFLYSDQLRAVQFFFINSAKKS